jgi:hypothetical protein
MDMSSIVQPVTLVPPSTTNAKPAVMSESAPLALLTGEQISTPELAFSATVSMPSAPPVLQELAQLVAQDMLSPLLHQQLGLLALNVTASTQIAVPVLIRPVLVVIPVTIW